jgi:hypothetical protein
MMRSIWAVVAGFLFIMVLSLGADAIVAAISPKVFNANGGTTNVVILLTMTVYVGAFAIVGSYITARLAPAHPMRHALILGALGLITSLILTLRVWEVNPAWFNILNLVLIMPYAWLGGRLRENEMGSSTPVTSSAAMA